MVYKIKNNLQWINMLNTNISNELTCTGLEAIRSPATLPPTTRPSGLTKETLIPPDLLLAPCVSVGMNDPDKESISKRPSYVTVPPEANG
uniref:Uncharacterized protein n=1 Tax=Rhizophora mucronata TaxID=61149 RepID=A0A2P2K2L3_RHIMU